MKTNVRQIVKFFFELFFFCVLTFFYGSARAASKDLVLLPEDEWSFENVADDADESEEDDGADLREAVMNWHKAWICRDVKGCREMLADNVLRVNQLQGEIQSGRDAVLASMAKEWMAYETDDHGKSAVQFALSQVEAQVNGNTALLHYYMDVTGGNRWDFDDTAAFTQIFTREDAESPWRLAFEADVWNLDYDTDTNAGGDEVFAYDYALPVRDLARAVKFYRPLLGEPEAVGKTTAVFEVKGSRLYLVAGEADKLARPRPGLPNGWPILTVPDFDGAKEAGEEAGVEFVGGEVGLGDMKVQYGYEPAGNLVGLAKLPVSSSDAPVLEADGDKAAGLPPVMANAEERLTQSWLNCDPEGYAKDCLDDVVALDASRVTTVGWTQGREALQESMEENFSVPGADGEDEDGGMGHPFAKVALTEVRTLRAGPWQVLARRRVGTGAAPWGRRAQALETLVFAAKSGKLALALTAGASRPRGLALEFDYAGLPVEKKGWEASSEALEALTCEAEHYTDEGWLGFWGGRAVLGMFEADPEEDKLPRKREAGAYLSLLVSDVKKAVELAKKSGAEFPVIPAINDRKNVDDMPGYRQALLTDSEGNAIVLTEYTGRSRVDP